MKDAASGDQHEFWPLQDQLARRGRLTPVSSAEVPGAALCSPASVLKTIAKAMYAEKGNDMDVFMKHDETQVRRSSKARIRQTFRKAGRGKSDPNFRTVELALTSRTKTRHTKLRTARNL